MITKNHDDVCSRNISVPLTEEEIYYIYRDSFLPQDSKYYFKGQKRGYTRFKKYRNIRK